MTTQLTQWRNQLHAQIDRHQTSPTNLEIASAAFMLADKGLEDLKDYPARFPFKNVSDHELYYLVVFPLFMSSYQYFGKVCRALEIKLQYDLETYADFLHQEIDLVNKFLKYHLQYSQHSSFEPMDIALRSLSHSNKPVNKKKPKATTYPQQIQISSSSPSLKSQVEYKSFLENQIKMLDQTPPVPQGKVYEFVGSQADAMENIEGWTEMRVIKVNGQIATLREVAEMWTTWFRKPIANIYSKKRINQDRKKEKAPFIIKMAQALRDSASRPRRKRVG